MAIKFDPISLKYEGGDADHGLVDLNQLGVSLQGASRLLGVAGHIVVTGDYAKKAPALSVRVLVAEPKRGSYELPAILMTLAPLGAPMFPEMADIAQKTATKAVEGLVNYVIAKFARKTNDSEKALEVAETALKEMGLTSRTAIGAVERMAATQRPAVRMLVAPIGDTCATAQIGEPGHGATKINKADREIIDAPDSSKIGPPSTFDVLISELDWRNKSCKVSLQSEENKDHRIPCEITDPVISMPKNPYSEAFSAKKWLRVRGKAQLVDGDIERLFISDVDVDAAA